jgi:DNA-binding transcriptional LysR family regulator
MTVGRIVEEINKMGIKLNVVIRSESVDLGKESVRAGLGIGLFYRGSAEAGLRDGSFKIIKIPRLKDIKIDCFIIYKKGTPLSGDASNFLALLRKWSKNRAERAQYAIQAPLTIKRRDS